MESFAKLAVARPISVSVIAALVIFFGLHSMTDMDLDLFPDIQSPTVMVSVNAGNRPAIEMEKRYGERMEQQLFTVRGLKSVEQVARTGELATRLTFNWGADIDLALVEVNRALASIAADREVDELIVSRFDPRQLPVFVLGLTAGSRAADLSDIRQLAVRQFAPAMEKLAGVAEVRVNGGRKKQVRVSIDPIRMHSFGLTLEEVESRIAAANVNVNAGTLVDGDRVLLVRGQGRFSSPEEIGQVIVMYLGGDNGEVYPLRVEDFASVGMADAELTGLVRVDGQEGLSLSIYKESGTNTVGVSRTIRHAIRGLAEDYPNLRFTTIADEAVLVERAVNGVKVAALLGMVLATGILVVFLRSPGPIVMVVVAIPVSLLATVCAMHFAGFSLNLMTLGGLALGTGMLVDNAIVVIESIYRRRSAGDSPVEAAVRGVGVVGGAIVSSTLTTCVVFLPVIFINGIAAEIASGIAFTVVISLLASLLVAAFLMPALSIWLFPKGQTRDVDPGSQYLQMLVYKLLGKPVPVIFTAAALVVAAIMALTRLGTNLLPPADPHQLALTISGPPGQTVEATSRAVDQLEHILTTVAGDQLETVLSEVGRLDAGNQTVLEQQSEENTAKILARLTPGSSAESVVNAVKPYTSQLYGVDIDWQMNTYALSQALGIMGFAITVEITGRSLPGIRRAAEAIEEQLGERKELWNIRTSFDGAPPHMQLTLKTLAAAELGVDLNDISSVIKAALDGKSVTSFVQGDERTDVLISLPSPAPQNLMDFRFLSTSGHLVKLGEVVNVQVQPGTKEIFRRDQHRIAKVTALVSADSSLPDARAAVEDTLSDIQYPWGVTAKLAGEEAERVKSVADFRWAATLALMLVFMVLAASFESLIHPLTILTSIPIALVGVAIVLYPLGQPIGIMAMLGFIILVGIAVNNAILLIQTARDLKANGHDTISALAQAVSFRLRPIIMTTATTVFALLPLALVAGDAAQLTAPLAWTVIGGIMGSTLGTLLVVPCVYLLLERCSSAVLMLPQRRK